MSDTKEKTARRAGKLTLAATVALLTAASVTVGGMFDSPAAILDDEAKPLVAYVSDGAEDDGDAEAGEENSEKTRRRASVSAREAILRLPLAVRLLVVLPLWALGTTVTALLGTLAASPIGQAALNMLLIFAVFAALFTLAAKAVFPDLPLKKILNRRSLTGLLFGALTLGALDAVLPLVWEPYEEARRAVLAVGTLALLGAAMLHFSLREQRRRLQEKRAEQAQPPASPERVEFVDPGGDSYIVDLSRAGKA